MSVIIKLKERRMRLPAVDLITRAGLLASGSLLAFSLMGGFAHAHDDAQFPTTTLNELIDQTNFVVANQCSGTLISIEERLVLTNNHCLEGYVDQVEKDETGRDGKIESVKREVYKDMELKQKVYKDFEEVSSASFQAKIIAHTAKYDLAILKIKADTIPQKEYSHIMPADGNVGRGDRVFVVGNPHMLDANLNEGVVSSVNRTLHWDETNEDVHYYGIDAGVNPGNSGGALYDANLQLIGVPAAKITQSDGLAFAIPAKTIRQFLDDNCYAHVYDQSKPSHADCVKTKLDKVNEIRVKGGMAPFDPPNENDSSPAEGWHQPSMSLEIKPDKPAPLPAAGVPTAPPVFKSWQTLLIEMIQGK